MTDTTGTMSDAEEWRRRDEREFLVRSLEDARREHEAGDMSEEDYRLLRQRDEQRLAEVEASLAAVPVRHAPTVRPDTHRSPGRTPAGPARRPVRRPADASTSSSWPTTLAAAEPEGTHADPAVSGRTGGRRRIWLAVLGVAFLVAGAVCLMLDLTAPSQAGQTPTGGTASNTLPAKNQIRQLLAQANEAAAEKRTTTAIALYNEVLQLTARNAEALAAWGWLDWKEALNGTTANATIAAEGQSAVAHAVQLDKKLYAAQFYLGDIYYQEGQYKKSVAHLAAFLADTPPPAWLKSAALVIRSAYAKDDRAVPSSVPLPSTVSITPGGTTGPSTGSSATTTTTPPPSTTTAAG